MCHALCAFMECLKGGSKRHLRDAHSGKTHGTNYVIADGLLSARRARVAGHLTVGIGRIVTERRRSIANGATSGNPRSFSAGSGQSGPFMLEQDRAMDAFTRSFGYRRSFLTVYEIDGSNFRTLEQFYDEVERVIVGEQSWGRNLDAFNDILSGGFGTPAEGFHIRWINSDLSRRYLGHDETVRGIEQKTPSLPSIEPQRH